MFQIFFFKLHYIHANKSCIQEFEGKELCCGPISSLITFGGGRTKWAAEVKTPRPYVSRWLPPLRQESHLWNHQFAPLRTRYVVRVQRAKSVKKSNKWVFSQGFLSWREISLQDWPLDVHKFVYNIVIIDYLLAIIDKFVYVRFEKRTKATNYAINFLPIL